MRSVDTHESVYEAKLFEGEQFANGVRETKPAVSIHRRTSRELKLVLSVPSNAARPFKEFGIVSASYQVATENFKFKCWSCDKTACAHTKQARQTTKVDPSLAKAIIRRAQVLNTRNATPPFYEAIIREPIPCQLSPSVCGVISRRRTGPILDALGSTDFKPSLPPPQCRCFGVSCWCAPHAQSCSKTWASVDIKSEKEQVHARTHRNVVPY